MDSNCRLVCGSAKYIHSVQREVVAEADVYACKRQNRRQDRTLPGNGDLALLHKRLLVRDGQL